MDRENMKQWKLRLLMVLTIIGNIAISVLIFTSTYQYRKEFIDKLAQIIKNEIIIILLSLGITYSEISLLFASALILTTLICTSYAEANNQMDTEKSQIIEEIFADENQPQQSNKVIQLQQLKTELQDLKKEEKKDQIDKEIANQLKLINRCNPRK